MMQVERRANRKWFLWVIVLPLVVVAVVICYFVWDAYFRVKDSDDEQQDTVTEIVTDDEDEDTEEEIEELESLGEINEKEEVVQYDGEDPNDAPAITGVLTHAEVTGDDLVLRVNIDQYLSSGNCRLSIVQGSDELYSEEVAVMGLTSTSTCEGFNVKMDQLGSGDMKILVSVNADGKTGVIKGGVTL